MKTRRNTTPPAYMAYYERAKINEEGGLVYEARDNARRAHILGGPGAVEVTALYGPANG